jgi:uncharacterized protein YdeI (YjbR/CyaY-like superfamily)
VARAKASAKPRAKASASPVYFASPAEFRAWLVRNHARSQELLVGFHRRETGRPSMTWPESVDEALCFGWIDGVRRRVDLTRYTIRFTPRRKTSMWSRINLDRVKVLTAEGRMTAAGLAIHEARKDPGHPGYSVAKREVGPFAASRLRAFKKDKAAWTFFTAQAPSYQKLIRFYVEISAKQEATRDKRFARVLESSRKGKRL